MIRYLQRVRPAPARVIALVLCWLTFCSSASAQVDKTERLIGFLQGRYAQLLRFADTIEVPFSYPRRPTIELRIAGQPYQMLLDSGTRISILNLTETNSPAAGLLPQSDTELLSDLDRRERTDFEDHTLSYATCSLASAGDLRIRNLPLRVYTYTFELPGNDFQGSLALQALRGSVIEFDNDAEKLRLYLDGSYVPAGNSTALPLLQLNGLSLIQARAGDQTLLLLLDTGFSGELLLGGTAMAALGESLIPTGEASETYAGFHEKLSGELGLLDTLTMQGQDWPGLARRPIEAQMIKVLMMASFSEDSALGRIDGIIGAGLLSKYNYAIDQSGSVLFIRER